MSENDQDSPKDKGPVVVEAEHSNKESVTGLKDSVTANNSNSDTPDDAKMNSQTTDNSLVDDARKDCFKCKEPTGDTIDVETKTEASTDKETANSAEHEKEQDTTDAEGIIEDTFDPGNESKDLNRSPAYGRGNSLFQLSSMPENLDRGRVNLSSPDLRKAVLDDGAVHARRQATSAFILGNRKTNKVAAVVAQPRALLMMSPPPPDKAKPDQETNTGELTATENVNDAKNVSEDVESEQTIENADSDTDKGDAIVGLLPAEAASASVVFAASDDGPVVQVEPKSILHRKMSLDPRLMCPPGLEVLRNKGTVIIRQRVDVDILEGCGAPNSYMIWDVSDEQLFFAGEASSCVCRWICGPNRGFTLELFSVQEDLVLTLHRTGCRCDCCCCIDCLWCLQKLYVADCLGRTLGAIKQKCSIFSAKFDIVDHDDNVLFKVRGPFCPCRCFTEIFFQIFDHTGVRQIGRIQKKWGGERADDVNVDHEYFDIRFPARLDSVDKALIIAAGFLVNYMYFEMS